MRPAYILSVLLLVFASSAFAIASRDRIVTNRENGSTYVLLRGGVSWEDYNITAQNMTGLNLAVIETAEENAWIRETFNGYDSSPYYSHLCIGVRWTYFSDTWMWTDPTGQIPIAWFNWLDTYPSDRENNPCVLMLTKVSLGQTGRWRNFSAGPLGGLIHTTRAIFEIPAASFDRVTWGGIKRNF